MRARASQLAGVGVVAALAIALDQLSKSWALSALDGRSIDLVLGARLALTFNSGAAFSIGSGRPALFAGIAVITVVALSVFVARSPLNRVRIVAFGLIIGGALGNVVDRLLRDHEGKVVDFIDLGWWPVFNVADSWLFIGVVLIMFDAWRGDRS